MVKLNLCIGGSVLVSGLASFALAAQPIHAADISVIGYYGNWNIVRTRYNPESFLSGNDQFFLTEEATDLGPFDVEIELTGYTPNSSVELDFFNLLQNNSNETWTKFDISIGTGKGNTFVQSDPSSGLFALTTFFGPFSTPFDVLNLIDDVLGFAEVTNSGTNISFDNGSIISDRFRFRSLTAPFFVLNVPIDANGNAAFTLRQIPTGYVPEPLTILGTGMAISFGGFFKRQKAKKSD
ncbi:PEP-CTERM sorting domain-containing protein [Gloeothece verrucosa]|uniref:PEP-CTERM protein-sorting domain-containing protein n=1 Tax=Gloeothece verrucosa (strain PCC 7822) TaxID=497965 RepID=E0U641_GLOV7|nr:PEP-CTERM sorting domain-containing protein [Gloeothece verrucosa]ADN17150.1 hypothetical protein Cyan7822_5269 [Gloeothece verrucosa PCC 7822]